MEARLAAGGWRGRRLGWLRRSVGHCDVSSPRDLSAPSTMITAGADADRSVYCNDRPVARASVFCCNHCTNYAQSPGTLLMLTLPAP